MFWQSADAITTNPPRTHRQNHRTYGQRRFIIPAVLRKLLRRANQRARTIATPEPRRSPASNTDKTSIFPLQDLLQYLLVSLGRSSFGPRTHAISLPGALAALARQSKSATRSTRRHETLFNAVRRDGAKSPSKSPDRIIRVHHVSITALAPRLFLLGLAAPHDPLR